MSASSKSILGLSIGLDCGALAADAPPRADIPKGDGVWERVGSRPGNRAEVRARPRPRHSRLSAPGIAAKAFGRPWVATTQYERGGPNARIMEYLRQEKNRAPLAREAVAAAKT